MLPDQSKSSLGEMFIANRSALRTVAMRIVRVGDVAEDILQDAYLKLTEGECARDVAKPFAYCCQVVRNLAMDYCRRKAVEAAYNVYSPDGSLPDVPGGKLPEAGLDERKLLDAVQSVLTDLPPRTRLAFELYRLHGMTQREIGARLGISATLVNFMLRDARDALAGCHNLYSASQS